VDFSKCDAFFFVPPPTKELSYVMFTPNQGKAAAELARGCRVGEQIGLAYWTPGGLISATDARPNSVPRLRASGDPCGPWHWRDPTSARKLHGHLAVIALWVPACVGTTAKVDN
jgi:hypothetical protein